MAYGAILGQTPDLSAYATNADLEAVQGEVSSLSSNALLKSGGTMTGQINMNSQKITNVANGTNSGDAVNYGQLNTTSHGLVNSGLKFYKSYAGRLTSSNYVILDNIGTVPFFVKVEWIKNTSDSSYNTSSSLICFTGYTQNRTIDTFTLNCNYATYQLSIGDSDATAMGNTYYYVEVYTT